MKRYVFRKKPVLLRWAHKEDAELLWHWANEPDVRRNSFNSQKIPLVDHLKWLSGKLDSDDSKIWILEYDGQPAGQIRYDRVNDVTAEVSFTVAKHKRGMGIGTKLLEITCPMAFEELKVKKIRGVTFILNSEASNAFGKAGFKLKRQEKISNHQCNIYEVHCLNMFTPKEDILFW